MSYKVIKVNYPEDYRTEKEERCHYHDYALLTLEADIGEQYGYLSFDCSFNNIFRKTFLEICGYPGDKQIGNTKRMWKGEG